MIFTSRAVLACYLFLCAATGVLSRPLTRRQQAISDIDILQFALTVSIPTGIRRSEICSDNM